VASRRYRAQTTAAFSYAANTTKTLVLVDAAASREIRVTEYGVSADGVTGAALALLVELVHVTMATSGTSTSMTPTQARGKVVASAHTAAHSFSAEPTVVTVISATYMTPNQPTLIVQLPLDGIIEGNLGEAVAIRITNPTSGTTVNVRGYLEYEEA
jgi:hypothetical protein